MAPPPSTTHPYTVPLITVQGAKETKTLNASGCPDQEWGVWMMSLSSPASLTQEHSTPLSLQVWVPTVL